mmetsp:Transcript_74526/g.155369  ORF Transcript_74526/g.155369 Transcript_74526/m.155369 type:complete len:374 (+) Transcript_74526:625-1746(+)
MASHKDFGTLGNCIIDKPLITFQTWGMHGSTAIHLVAAQRWALSQLLHQICDVLTEVVVDLVVDDETLWPSAILAHVLVGTSHHQLGQLFGIDVVANDEGVLSTELQNHRCQSWSSLFHHLLADANASHKDDLIRLSHERGAGFGIACRKLDEVHWCTDSLQALPDHLAIVLGRPRSVLGHLDDDRVSCKESGNDGVEDVVEGVVPRNKSSHDADRNPFHATRLVQVHQPRVTVLRQQVLLAVHRNPSQLLQGHQDLADHCVDHRLARLPASDNGNGLGILQNELLDGAKQLSSLCERGFCPNLLSLPRASYGLPHIVRRHCLHLSKELHGRWVPAWNCCGGRLPLLCVVEFPSLGQHLLPLLFSGDHLHLRC